MRTKRWTAYGRRYSAWRGNDWPRGQNKLVLSDSDAGVARVHAMVRIESEAAFIANLCERRSIFVAGAEVRSGEEVRLSVGTRFASAPMSCIPSCRARPSFPWRLLLLLLQSPLPHLYLHPLR